MIKLTFNFSARGVYYVTTNADPPFARGYPGAKGRKAQKDDKYAGVR